jgi:hypothetical protein
MSILLPQDAQQKSATAAHMKQLKTLDRVRASDTLTKHINAVGALVERAAAAGEYSVCFNLVEFFGNEPTAHKGVSLIDPILRDLGYKTDFTFSSNYINERMTVSWSKKGKE